jgi:monoamine oxidase
MTVAWALTPWSLGVGPAAEDWTAATPSARYLELMRPEGPIVFAGEHLSHVIYWQEGAVLSAHEALRIVEEQAATRAAA